jgi:anhydro-N-acetylmuramic acid kinase
VRGAHAKAVAGFEGVDVVGFHGQTLAHEPARGRTHQIGRGDLLALETGRRVVWDFRSADVASGGEGAPLVPFFHFALARRLGLEAPVAFLNLGGVGNVTWADPRAAAPEAAGALMAFDTGPGNALIDDFLQARLGRSHDEGGAVAAAGRVDAAFWRGWRRIRSSQESHRSRWTGRSFTGSWRRSRGSRPRTARRRSPR